MAHELKTETVDALYARAEAEFEHWEVVKDLVDEMIDLMLNYRQSGHPGGSRSKVHMLLATLLSGAMRWDLLRPWRPFQDRFVLSAGHTAPWCTPCSPSSTRRCASGTAARARPSTPSPMKGSGR
jgi:hypothetical protein